ALRVVEDDILAQCDVAAAAVGIENVAAGPRTLVIGNVAGNQLAMGGGSLKSRGIDRPDVPGDFPELVDQVIENLGPLLGRRCGEGGGLGLHHPPGAPPQSPPGGAGGG